MTKEKPRAVTRSELVIQTWKKLKSDSVGAPELEEIQRALTARFGNSAVESPATIARTLADVGVPLRHPEVLDFDTLWRDQRSLDPGELDFSTIDATRVSIRALNTVWDSFKGQKDAKRLASFQSLLTSIRQQLRLVAGSKTATEQRKKVAIESELWLGIWLQNPDIFEDWLELRMNSVQFQTIFGK